MYIAGSQKRQHGTGGGFFLRGPAGAEKIAASRAGHGAAPGRKAQHNSFTIQELES